ncbi:MAG: aminotransferase class I/II-fold pyridoxal phosphate-dependent enzyme [Gemmatimonadota bacterium]|nr:aminotransferase class I/II-fold pyridoxal phosphate-dependent enzyme [Gemmatimonadota bacterium]
MSPSPDGPRPGRSTIAVHGGSRAHQVGEPVVTPIYQSVNFQQEVGTAEGMRYPRDGNHPNAEVVQRRLSMLEGAEAALVLASGQGATACAMLALLRPGDHLIASSWVYGGTQEFFTTELEPMGIEVTFVDPLEPRGWRKQVRQETRAIFLETPVNPTCRVLDLAPIAVLTRDSSIALVVDTTFASPINYRAIEHGADVVIQSTTKYLNGHHDAIGGVVLGSASFIEEVRQKMIHWGQAPDPFGVWLLERGLKTLELRVTRSNENAMRVAQWCSSRPEIVRVHYPGLEHHPDHALAAATMNGFGGMMAIELAGGPDEAERFVGELRLITHAPSLGGVDSLVSEPRFTSHTNLTAEQRAGLGVPDGFLRLSLGIEDAEDLIADIEQALLS